MENNNCHFQVGSLVTANLSWQLALPISIGANFGHNPYSTSKFRWRHLKLQVAELSLQVAVPKSQVAVPKFIRTAI